MTDDSISLDGRIRTTFAGMRIQVGPGKRIDRSNTASTQADGSVWAHDLYRVRLIWKGREFTTTYKMGIGFNGNPPHLDDVLNSLSSDSASVENARDFDEWIEEYGYFKGAHGVYTVCMKQAARLKKFLGDEGYDLLLWHTEGL